MYFIYIIYLRSESLLFYASILNNIKQLLCHFKQQHNYIISIHKKMLIFAYSRCFSFLQKTTIWLVNYRFLFTVIFLLLTVLLLFFLIEFNIYDALQWIPTQYSKYKVTCDYINIMMLCYTYNLYIRGILEPERI